MPDFSISTLKRAEFAVGDGRRARFVLVSAFAVLILLACLPAAGHASTVWAVGDGAVPEPTDDQIAAQIQSAGLDRFLYLGDVYDTGTAQEFATRYHPSFGRFKGISHPTPGNHEWDNRSVGYDPYWGGRARQANGDHWYSFDFDGWHFISLNTLEPHDRGSPQFEWLQRDLARYSGSCTIAFTHYPRLSASRQGDRRSLEDAWQAMRGRAVMVLGGHDHNYQRFAPRTGIVQLVVGTGGRDRYRIDATDSRLRAFTDDHFGALRMELTRGRAGLEFVALDGSRLDRDAIGCRPHTPLTAIAITRPRHRRVYNRGFRTIRGRTRNAARGPVRLTLVRRRGRRCSAFTGRRFRRASCRTRRSFRARGVRRFRYRLSRRRALGRGRYRLTVRVRGVDGRVKSRSSRFRVR